MSALQAILLGLVQGITEFLPISSTGHLKLVPWALGWQVFPGPRVENTFDVALHLGTFLAVIAYFRADVVRLVAAWAASLREHTLGGKPERKLAWMVLISTLPAALAGFLGQDFIESRLGTPLVIASALVGVALLLALGEALSAKRRGLEAGTWGDAAAVGLAQVLALVPGTSRSGITILAGLATGLTREAAARYSFLISIPIIGGAAAANGLQVAGQGLPAGFILPFALGIAASALSGAAAIAFLLHWLRTRTLWPFIVYRLALGAVLLALLLR